MNSHSFLSEKFKTLENLTFRLCTKLAKPVQLIQPTRSESGCIGYTGQLTVSKVHFGMSIVLFSLISNTLVNQNIKKSETSSSIDIN